MPTKQEQAASIMRELGASEDRIAAYMEAIDARYLALRGSGEDLTVCLGARHREMPDALKEKLGLQN